jgi:hypothetical protein
MKKIIILVVLLVLAYVGWKWYSSSKSTGQTETKQEAITLKKHSPAFNQAVTNSMNAYFEMAAAFVDADTARVKEHNRKFIQLLDSIPMDELKKDTANIYDVAMSSFTSIKSNAESILVQADITEMRKDFSMVSENLYPFFKVVNYEGEKMYWQHCPMAFGDEAGANWIGRTTEVVNPYLGKNHPQYKATMLHCGMVKDTIKAQ